jgi:putative transposase
LEVATQTYPKISDGHPSATPPRRARPKQAETGTPVAEVIRRMGISEQTFYRWKKLYGGLGVGELRRAKQLEEENRKLKQLVADLSLDKHILQDVLAKKL